MLISNTIYYLKKKIVHLPGWKTKRKIVVFDSDDWGSLVAPNEEALKNLSKKGLNILNNPYKTCDSLEEEGDLSALFDVLKKHKDINGNHPCITANTVMANPDFDKIRSDKFNEYHYELFTDSYLRYQGTKKTFDVWQQGVSEKLFFPQFHAREHLNVMAWMRELKKENPIIHAGFNNNVFALSESMHPLINQNFASACYAKSQEDQNEIEDILRDGLRIFQEIFGFYSKSFIGTGYIWSSNLEPVLASNGVKYIKGKVFQREPVYNSEKLKKRFRYTGQKNKYGQIHLVRNALFEPTIMKNTNMVEDCLRRMEIAFGSGKPVIISAHRLNFIGSRKVKNRTENLRLLDSLLKKMLIKHPETEFLNSDELGAEVLQKK